MPRSKRSRLWKTALYFGDRKAFLALLAKGIKRLAHTAARKGMVPVLRLDGGSDTGIAEDAEVRTLCESLGVRQYEYTKDPQRAVSGDVFTVYSHARSLAETRTVLDSGGAAAVVFVGDLPTTWEGYRVIDGDAHDLRFLDREDHGIADGYVVGLRFKTARKRDQRAALALQSGFAQRGV